MMMVNKSLARLYLDGKTTYSRTSSSALSAEGVSIVAHAAEQCGVGAIFDPLRLPMVEEDNEQAHEVQRPTMEGVHRAMEIMRVDPAILSEEDFCLAEITRQLIACGANVQVETPALDDYPAWARELDWQRPTDASAAFLLRSGADMESGYYAYPVDLIALDQMLKYGLGRPSTLAGHAEKFAGRNLYQPETGLTEKGMQWVGMTPDIFLWPETSVAIEAVLDQAAVMSDQECIDRVLELLREEQEAISKHLHFQSLAAAFAAPAGPSGQSVPVPKHPTNSNPPPVSAKHRPAGVSP